MKYSFILYGLIAATLLYGIYHNFGSHPKPVTVSAQSPLVVELFTAEKCPSCPAADKILAALAEEEHVIALSCHVSYMGKDNFAREFCDVRQHGYGSLQDNKIYTPQMSINGGMRFIGYKENQLRAALAEAAKQPPLPILLHEDAQRNVMISLPQMDTSLLRIWAFGYNKENAISETSRITNPALSLDNLGDWDGSEQMMQMQVADPKITGLIVLAQENAYGRIVAAGKVDLR